MPKENNRIAELRSGLNAFGISMSQEKLEAVTCYAELLLSANTRANLTGAGSWEELVNRHIIDSLVGGAMVQPPESGLVVDVGSGAGLPGIPLAIMWDRSSMVLVETRTKRTAFLRSSVEKLKLSNIVVLERRAEEIGRDTRWREKADLVTARGVAPLAILLEYALPLLKNGGRFIAWKGPGLENEMSEAETALSELRAEAGQIKDYSLPDGRTRRILVVNKTGPVPAAYPRRPGIVSKRPLGFQFDTIRRK